MQVMHCPSVLPACSLVDYKIPQRNHGAYHCRDHLVLLITALNSPICVGVIVSVEIINTDYSTCLVGVEITWVQDPGSSS